MYTSSHSFSPDAIASSGNVRKTERPIQEIPREDPSVRALVTRRTITRKDKTEGNTWSKPLIGRLDGARCDTFSMRISIRAYQGPRVTSARSFELLRVASVNLEKRKPRASSARLQHRAFRPFPPEITHRSSDTRYVFDEAQTKWCQCRRGSTYRLTRLVVWNLYTYLNARHTQ